MNKWQRQFEKCFQAKVKYVRVDSDQRTGLQKQEDEDQETAEFWKRLKESK